MLGKRKRSYCACLCHDGSEAWHGALSGYYYHGCQCVACMATARSRWDNEAAGKKQQCQHYGRVRVLERRDGRLLSTETKDWLHALLWDPCAYCGAPAASVDHIDPDGYSEWPNLAPACEACNISKHRTPLIKHMLAVRVRRERDACDRDLTLLAGRGPR